MQFSKKGIINKWSALMLLILIGVSYFLITQNGLFKKADIVFLSTDKPVSTILLQDESDTIRLFKDKSWLLQNGAEARQEAVKIIFDITERVQVKAPAAKEWQNELSNKLRHSGTKALFYLQDGSFHTGFYLYYDSIKNSTFAMGLEGNSVYSVFVPGYKHENLAIFFNTDEKYWLDKANVLRYNMENMVILEMDYLENKDIGFDIELKQDGTYALHAQEDINNALSKENIDYYLSLFSEIQYEYEVNPQAIENGTPFFNITITFKNENTESLTGLYKPSDKEGYDKNFLYLHSASNQAVYLVKFIYIDPLLKEGGYFLVN